MRISDWSSDVCSSDLGGARGRTVSQPGTAPAQGRADAAVDWARVRGDFPLLRREVNGKPLVYFDSANTGQKPAAVIEAVDGFYRHHNANVSRAVHTPGGEATERYEDARPDRQSVVEGKRGSVRVDLGGRRIVKKKRKKRRT